MAKRRIAIGITPVKGTVFECSDCKKPYKRFSVKSYRCAPCQEKSRLDRARAAVHAKSRAKGAPEFVSAVACGHCKSTFARAHPRDKYCSDCRELRRAGRLPSYQATQKAGAKRWLEERRKDPEWRAAEADRLRAKRARRKQKPSFAINERMSAAIRSSLKGGKNGASWEALVGYAVMDLLRHLERQFLPGMSWDRRSEIHIDHIVPLASFSFETADDPEFRAAWAITNLRPLWKADNLAKNDQRLFLL